MELFPELAAKQTDTPELVTSLTIWLRARRAAWMLISLLRHGEQK